MASDINGHKCEFEAMINVKAMAMRDDKYYTVQ